MGLKALEVDISSKSFALGDTRGRCMAWPRVSIKACLLLCPQLNDLMSSNDG
ncbi:hypothetical protein M419DRAFT_119881 [Trichoderma reesei RUT C-30]|uniref:Uncharacterized protein n=1 Tax=Hypocrea jecorina (strain ATCC 56765 / BCRC 32924 / NRRL 11460 / Rut C-30) TaxID=1344414 RepID=A0A024S5X1_HYPJR|nr:hypothetical protein M419DRAFT_119881 [Trichoderma reesei RUT C-30]